MKMGLRLVVMLGFFVVMFVYVGATGYVFLHHLAFDGIPGWEVVEHHRLRLQRDLANASGFGLEDGDEITALDGEEFKNSSQYDKAFARSDAHTHFPSSAMEK